VLTFIFEDFMKTFAKRVAKVIAALFLCLLLLVLLLPTIVSQSAVQNFLLAQLNKQIPGKIATRKLEVSWLKGLDLQGLTILDPAGRNVVSCERISLEESLFSFVKSPLNIAQLTIEKPKCVLIEEKDGSFSLLNAFTTPSSANNADGEKKKKSHSSTQQKTAAGIPPLFADVKIQDGSFSLQPQASQNNDVANIDVANFSCHLSIQGLQEAKLSLVADVIKNKETGSIALDLQAKDFADVAAFYEKALFSEENGTTAAEIALSCKINALPLHLIDGFAALSNPKLKGIIPAALGDTLDTMLLASLKNGKTNVSCNVQSKNLKTDLQADLVGKELQITKGPNISFQVEPGLVVELQDLFPELASISLKDKAELALTTSLSSISLPFHKEKNPLGINITLDSTKSLKIQKQGWDRELAVDIHSKINAESLEKEVQASFQMLLASGINKVSIQTEAQAKTLLSAENSVDVTTKIQGQLAPLAGLLIGDEALPSHILGRTQDLTLTCKLHNISPTPQAEGTLSLNSETIKHNLAFTFADQQVTIAPFSFSYNLLPDRLQAILAKEKAKNPQLTSLPQLTSPFALSLVASSVVIDTTDIQNIEADFKLSVLPFELKAQSGLDSLKVNKILLSLLKTKSAPYQVAFSSSLGLENMLAPLPDLLGNTLDMEANASLLLADGKPVVKEAKATVKADTLSLSVNQNEPLTLQYLLTPRALKALFKENTQVTLLEDMPIVLTLDPLNDFTKVETIKGALKCEKIAFETSQQKIGPYSLHIPFMADIKQGKTSGTMSLSSQKENDKTSLKADFQIAKAAQESTPQGPLPELFIKTQGQFQDLPIDTLLKLVKKEELVAILGKTLSGNWLVDYKGAKAENKAELKVALDQLALTCNLTLKDGKIQEINGKEAVSVRYLLSPLAFQELMKSTSPKASDKGTLSLKESANISFSIPQFAFPLDDLLQHKELFTLLDRAHIVAKLSCDALTIKEEAKQKTFDLLPLKGELKLLKGTRKINFSLKNEKIATKTFISIEGVAKNLWNAQGLSVAESHIEMDAKLEDIPLELLEVLPQTKENGKKITQLLGPKMNVACTCKIEELKNGLVNADIKSDHLTSTLSSSLKQGKLYLNSPCKVRLELTENAGKELFKGVSPMLATGIQADHPLDIVIDDNGFCVPLSPFVKQGIQVKKATINLGKIKVNKGGALDVIAALLNLPSSDKMSLWFTPLYLEVRNGVVICSRSDALLDNTVQIATWGTIDLVHDNVDMIVGVLGPGLARSLRLSRMDPNYVLQLPLRGKLATATIDKTKATAKIASLGMMQTKDQTQALIGGLIGIAAQALDKDAPVPPPTTFPYPWTQR
jgi:hypothetical protein